MVAVKIYTTSQPTQSKRLVGTKYYANFRNALADIVNKTIFNDISSISIDSLNNPAIRNFSQENNVATDFEFRYENGIFVYVNDI